MKTDMQNLGDIFKETVTGSKIKSKIDILQEKIDIARPILKTFKMDDTKEETLQKAKSLLLVFYTPKVAQDMIINFNDPRRQNLDTEYIIHRMYSTVAFRLDQLQELKDEFNEELGENG